MKDCCMKNLDKAKRIGRAQYRCVKCDSDVSLAWVYYQQAICKHNEEYMVIRKVEFKCRNCGIWEQTPTGINLYNSLLCKKCLESLKK